MSRNWIRDVNSRQQMMRQMNNDEAEDGVGGDVDGGVGSTTETDADKETHIGTWDSKDLDEFAKATREKFSLVNPHAAQNRGYQ